MMTYQNFETRINTLIGNRYIALSLLSVITVIAFFPTFSNELMTGWDDQWQVTNTFTSGGFTFENLKEIFTVSFHGQYSPVNQCLYILIYEIGGYTPIYYHAASLILHVLNGWLVFFILKQLLVSTTSLSANRIAWICFLTTLLFLIHPLQVETVAWMSASKIVLSTFFYLLATYAFLGYLAKERMYYYLLTVFFFTCAYGAKEQSVIFPLWIILIASFYKLNFSSRKIWLMILPFFALAVFYGLMFVFEIKARPFGHVTNSLFDFSWWQRVVFSCYALIEYPLKWFVPYKLLYMYYYPMNPGEPLPVWLLAYPTLLAIILVSLWKPLNHWSVKSGILFFLIHILLVLHIIPISRPHVVADRYMYLASTGLSFIVFYLLTQYYPQWKPIARRIMGLIILLAVITFGTYTYHRTHTWHDTKNLRHELKILLKNHGEQPDEIVFGL